MIRPWVIGLICYLGYSSSYAGVECITKVSNSLTTPDWHCSKHCSGWESTRPTQKLTLNMDEKFKKMDAFFKNPTSTCAGGSPCGYSSIPTPSTSSNAQQVFLNFKTWSRPVTITLMADVCIYNKTIAPATEQNENSTSSNPTPPTRPVTQSLNKPAVPPNKYHAVEEAGPLEDNCERMQNNWIVDAKNYCLPYNVDVDRQNIRCSQSSDGLFKKAEATIKCM